MATLVQERPYPLNVPGPRPMSILGATGNLLRFGMDPLNTVGNLFRAYGRIVSMVSGAKTRLISPDPNCPGTVFVYGADLTRQIVTQHDLYEKSAISGAQPGPEKSKREHILWNWGTGLFHVNGDDHRLHRRLLMPAFHKKQIETYRDDMVALTQRMLDSWQAGERRDIREAMTYLTLYVAGKTLFNEDIQIAPSSVGLTLQQMVYLMMRMPLRLMSVDLPGLPYRRLLDLSEKADREIRQMIAAKRASGINDNDVLAMLLRAQDEDGKTLTNDEVIGHAGIIFMAGHETSANALTWTLFLLSQHPDIAAALHDELSGVLKGDAPTLDQLGQLPLLERVIKESMRIIPPVPFNHRLAGGPTELDGYYIPKATELFVSIYHTHHDPDLYPQPEQFDPERWLTITPNAFEYDPFSAGPRMCIGAPFAMLEIKIVLAMIVQRYRLEYTADAPLNRRVRITMSPARSLDMLVRPQDRQFRRGVGGVRGNIREMINLPA
ncbi:MAG: cytochrome P450 [Anaerolineae bacterium]|nr:cytochrome P450 [Anaerolineae bacterium]